MPCILTETGIYMTTLKEAFWAAIRKNHNSLKTAKSYWRWIRLYCDFYRQEDGTAVSPRTLGKPEVEAFLNHLTNHKQLGESAHEQAFYALLYLYSKVYDTPLEGVKSVRPSQKVNVPVVMSHAEVASVLDCLDEPYKLASQIMYATGMRRSEVLKLQLKDIDFGNGMFTVWHSKHKHSRTVPLPDCLVPAIERRMKEALMWQRHDSSERTGGIIIQRGDVEKRKATFDPTRYWLFCSSKLSRDPITGKIGRNHLDDDNLNDMVKDAAKAAGVMKRITCHTFRHSAATHWLIAGVNIREIQRLLGHRDLASTQIYTHVSLIADKLTPSLLDRLPAVQSGNRSTLAEAKLGTALSNPRRKKPALLRAIG
jgi:integron integrase